MFYDGDTTIFLNDCGVTAVVSGCTGTIKGIFDAPYKSLNTLSLEVENYNATFTCKTSDATGVNSGNVITINTVNYYARGRQDDGTGMSVIILSDE